jgi:hypothetical protein
MLVPSSDLVSGSFFKIDFSLLSSFLWVPLRSPNLMPSFYRVPAGGVAMNSRAVDVLLLFSVHLLR